RARPAAVRRVFPDARRRTAARAAAAGTSGLRVMSHLRVVRGRWSRAGWGDESLSDGDQGRLRARAELELREDVADVRARGALADVELGRDLVVGHAAGDEREDRPLPGGE